MLRVWASLKEAKETEPIFVSLLVTSHIYSGLPLWPLCLLRRSTRSTLFQFSHPPPPPPALLGFQQCHGREILLLRILLGIVLFTSSSFISTTVVYSHAVTGNSGYGSGSSCFVDAGFPKTISFGAPVLALIFANVRVYRYTVARLHEAPNIGDTKIKRNNVLLYSKLGVATGASWILGSLYDWTALLFLAFVANRRVFVMAREKMSECCAYLMPARVQESASHTASCTIKMTKSTVAIDA